MTEFKSFQMFLILMMPFTAVARHYSKITVRVGDEATLSCEDVKDLPEKCRSTTWIFNYLRTGPTETLFEYGQIHIKAAAKSDRLSVTEKCSLVIKKVKDEDAGRYTCRQFDKQQKVTDSQVDLTVIKRDNVATPPTTTTKLPTTTTKRTTKATTRPPRTVKATTKATKATTRPTTTKVTQATTRPTTTTTTDPVAGETSPNADLPAILIPVAVVSAALLIIVVAVIRWKRAKGNNTQLDDNTAVFTVQADPPDAVSYASIRYKKKTKSKARVQREDDTVTYSTLNTSTGISLH